MLVLETVRHITITYNIGDLADWISALATFLAVIVSLYLANRRDFPKIHFSVLKKDNSIRITNKSYQIVELMLKIDDDKNYIKIVLPPLRVDNPNMRDDEPFNHDIIVIHIKNSKKKIHKIKGYDLITKAHYHALFYFKNGKWQVKQYKLFHLGTFAL